MESAFPEDLRSASFLGSFNSLFPGVGGGQTSTEREAAARLPLPSPRRAAGGRQLAHRPGRFAQTPDSTAPVGPPRWCHYHHRAPEGAAHGGSGSSPRRGRIRASPPFPRVP